jgi:hypothetical protein
MQHSFKIFLKSYYIYTVSLLNLFKITLYTTCFYRHWPSSGVLKLFVETAVLAFCASNVRLVVPLHIRVFRRSGCFLLLRCVFRLLVPTKQIRDFSTFNVSNVSRLNPSTRCVTAANNICKSLDVFNKHNISLEGAFSFV